MSEGDKREGSDDLFEDLDKFFAPIKDVDWPEADEPPATAEASDEEHVVVQTAKGNAAEEGSSTVHEAADAVPESREPSMPRHDEADVVTDAHPTDEEPPAGVEDHEADEPAEAVWYDTAVMEPIDDDLAGEEPIVVGEAAPAEVPGQAGLFAPGGDEGGAPDPGDDEGWPSSESDEEPSSADVEAAADHLAESMRQQPTVSFDDVHDDGGEELDEREGADVLANLGADEVEEDILSDLDEPAATRTVKVGAEGFGGPSWQDPTSVEVGADLDRHGGRDVPAAFVTGLVLAALAFGSLLIDKALFAVVAALIVLVAQGELFGVMHKAHKQPATAVGLVSGVLVLWGAYRGGEGAVVAMFALGIMATLLWFMAVPAVHRKDTLLNVGLTVFNVGYIPILGSFLLLLLRVSTDGKSLVAAVIVLTFVFDTIAFLAGATFGGSSIQRPLAPDTSPKKSWEGLVAATFVTIVLSVAFVGSFVTPFENHRMNAFLLGVVISVGATFGDLAESLIKRDLGLKDMGSVLPGHGGVLDRIDSLLFSAPAAYLLFRVLYP